MTRPTRPTTGPTTETTRRLARVTQAAIAIFAVLYVVSARLYPGGTRVDPTTIGFSVRDNYWCDLLDERAYGGADNPARPIAIGAMLVLCVGLGALWWAAPALFPEARRRAWLVRGAGLGASALVPLVGTRHHDLAINASGLLALVAFVTTATAIGRRGSRALGALAALALLLAVGTWAIWATRIGIAHLALVQKAAFFSLLAWAARLASELRAPPRDPRGDQRG